MASLDKLASMEGWDLGDDAGDDGLSSIASNTKATKTTHQHISTDATNAFVGPRRREKEQAVEFDEVAGGKQSDTGKGDDCVGRDHCCADDASAGYRYKRSSSSGSSESDVNDISSNRHSIIGDLPLLPPTHKASAGALMHHTTDFAARKSSFSPSTLSPAFIGIFGVTQKTEKLTDSSCTDFPSDSVVTAGRLAKDGSQRMLNESVPLRRGKSEGQSLLADADGIRSDNAEIGIATVADSVDGDARHPLDTLRKKSAVGGRFASESGRRNRRSGETPAKIRATASDGGRVRKFGRRDSNSRSDVTAKLRALLHREKEGRARDRAARDVAEREKTLALASLEAETQRALELENRVRMLNVRIDLSNAAASTKSNSGGLNARCRSNGPNPAKAAARRARSLSPVNERAAERRGGGRGPGRGEQTEQTEQWERHAQMSVIADAAQTAREEACTALDSMEGFASLNRKLIEELRTVVGTRDELSEIVSRERAVREQLEAEVDQLLGGGLAAALKDKEEELEEHCAQERQETMRVSALHARMEEEYRLALLSLGRERERLEEVVDNLQGQLADARRDREVRAREERERAMMSAEEIASIRAGFAPRGKRRARGDYHQSLHFFGSSQRKITGNGAAETGTHLDGHTSPASTGTVAAPSRRKEGGWLKVQRMRIETQQLFAERAAVAAAEGRNRNTSSMKNDNDQSHTRLSHTPYGRDDHRSIAGPKPEWKVRNHEDQHSQRGGGAGNSSIGGGNNNGGTACVVVQRAAADIVEAFVGDFVPTPRPCSLQEATASSISGCAGGGGRSGTDHDASSHSKAVPKMSKWAAIGRAGKLSARATAVCAQEAEKAALAEANARLRSTINSTARALSAAFFSLLDNTTSTTANLHISAADATIASVGVRRLVQTCGMLRSTASGPTLAHVDVELQQNAVGRGRVGHREFFKVIMSLAECRFSGEPRDDALEKITRMLKQHLLPRSGPSSPSHASNQQATGVNGNKEAVNVAISKKISFAGPDGSGGDSAGEALSAECLMGAERVLERDRRALEAIFSHYTLAYSASLDPGASRGRLLLCFVGLAAFCKDFELTPGLVSREDAHRTYTQLAYPHETKLTPRAVAAREGGLLSRQKRTRGEPGGAAAAGLGLNLRQWMAWLGLVAVGCTWFDQQRGHYNSPTKKVLGLLQWMEGSAGKGRISSRRGAPILPAFNLLHPDDPSGEMRQHNR